MRVQSRRDGDGNSAGESGTCIVCTQELTRRSRNYEPRRVAIAIESQHDFGFESIYIARPFRASI
jgi:hypothetical protein